MRRIRFEVPGCQAHSVNPTMLDALEVCPACSELYMAYLGLLDRMDVVNVEVVDADPK